MWKHNGKPNSCNYLCVPVGVCVWIFVAAPKHILDLATLTTTGPLENSGGRTDEEQVGGSGKEDTAAEELDSVETSTDSEASTAVLPSSTTHESKMHCSALFCSRSNGF